MICNGILGIAVMAGEMPRFSHAPTAATGQTESSRKESWRESRRRRRAESIVAQWPPIAQAAARYMIARYGPPHRASSKRLLWKNNGAWEKTIVTPLGPFRSFPRMSEEVIEQTARYPFLAQRASLLPQFDPSLRFENGRLTAANETEEMNVLELNLAGEILGGARSPASARRLMVSLLDQLDAGKRSQYFDALRFNRPWSGVRSRPPS